MPVLRVELNRQVDDATAKRVLDSSRRAIHEVKGDSATMISVALGTGSRSVIGESNGDPVANLHLISFNLNAQVTSALTRRLNTILWQELAIPPDRIYILYENVSEAHLSAWGGRTFAEIMLPSKGCRFDVPRRLRGRLASKTFNSAGGMMALADFDIELWEPIPARDEVRGVLPDSRMLGAGKTDKDGFFEIHFARQPKTNEPPAALSLRIFEPHQILSDNIGIRRFVVTELPVPLSLQDPTQPAESDNGERDIAIGTIPIDFYDYDPSWPFPYTVANSICNGFSDLQASRYAAAQDAATRIGLELLGAQGSNRNGLSVQEIQAAFPKSPTMLIEERQPGTTRSDEFFGERLLNCFHPPLFRLCPENNQWYKLEYNWQSFQRRTDLTLLSFSARFRVDSGHLLPVDISIGLNNVDDPAAFTTFTPASGDAWMHAKRLVRAHHHNVIAQFQGHLAAIHFNLEQYAVALMRCVWRNPIRQLLAPFLREVLAINEKGRQTLVGGQDITGLIEPMSKSTLTDWIGDTIGRQDWRNWSPRRPLCAGHSYAYAAHLYWEAVRQTVDEFVARHLSGIQAHWQEIHEFSANLVGRAVPYVAQGMEETAVLGNWYCTNEIAPVKGPGDRAVSPVTQVQCNPANPDIENLKQLSRYLIFLSTFAHSWIHSFMATDLGELRYSGMVRNGGMGPESDDQLIAPSLHAMYALGSTMTLSNMNCGYMLLNEGGDVPQQLIDKVKNARPQFAAYGFNIDHLCSRLST